jgi:hypothetical protein
MSLDCSTRGKRVSLHYTGAILYSISLAGWILTSEKCEDSLSKEKRKLNNSRKARMQCKWIKAMEWDRTTNILMLLPLRRYEESIRRLNSRAGYG